MGFVFAMLHCNSNPHNPLMSTFLPTSSASSTTCNPPNRSTNSLPSSLSSSSKIASLRVAPRSLPTSPTNFCTPSLLSSANWIVNQLSWIGLVGPSATTQSRGATTPSLGLCHRAPNRASAPPDCRAADRVARYHDSGAIAGKARGCKMGTSAETRPPSPVSKVYSSALGSRGKQT
jgi:hypothetical protein